MGELTLIDEMKETPKLSNRICQEQNYGAKEFTQQFGSKI